MSLATRAAAASLIPSHTAAAPPPADPVARARAALAAADLAVAEGQRRDVDLSADLAAALANPLAYPDEAFLPALLGMRRAIADNTDKLTQAGAKRRVAAKDLEDTIVAEAASLDGPRVAMVEKDAAALAAWASEAEASGAQLIAAVTASVQVRDAGRDILRGAGRPFAKHERDSLGDAWPSIADVDVFVAAGKLTAYLAPGAVARRKGERERFEAVRASEREEQALRGNEGEVAQAAAQARQREGLALFYGGERAAPPTSFWLDQQARRAEVEEVRAAAAARDGRGAVAGRVLVEED